MTTPMANSINSLMQRDAEIRKRAVKRDVNNIQTNSTFLLDIVGEWENALVQICQIVSNLPPEALKLNSKHKQMQNLLS